jgi:hypothetical protein
MKGRGWKWRSNQPHKQEAATTLWQAGKAKSFGLIVAVRLHLAFFTWLGWDLLNLFFYFSFFLFVAPPPLFPASSSSRHHTLRVCVCKCLLSSLLGKRTREGVGKRIHLLWRRKGKAEPSIRSSKKKQKGAARVRSKSAVVLFYYYGVCMYSPSSS